MSEHAAVKEEHRQLLIKVIAAIDYRAYGDARQLLADFARDERLKEAELSKQAYYDCETEDGTESFESWIGKRIEQLKRGEA